MFGIFKKKSRSETHKSRYITLQVKEVVRETEDATTLVFETPESGFKYKAGQYITLILPIEGEHVRRSYSLNSSPLLEENPAVTVKRIEDGKVSNYLHQHMKVGDSFEVLEPMGNFTPDLDSGKSSQYILFAGGSGITPLMSILKTVLVAEPQSKILLVYQNRNESTKIFASQLKTLEDTNQDRLKVVNILSQPGEDASHYQGRLTEELIKEELLDIPGFEIQQGEYFLCGPSGMMHTIEKALESLNVPKTQVHKESFIPGVSDELTGNKKESKVVLEQVVTIVLDGEEHKVTVPPNKSILDAALDDNIDMPFSCQSGLCTACRGKLLQGKVYMDEDEGLTDKELEDGYVLNCQAPPAHFRRGHRNRVNRHYLSIASSWTPTPQKWCLFKTPE